MTNFPVISPPSGNEQERAKVGIQLVKDFVKIALPFAAGWFTHALTGRRDRKNRLAQACIRFRSVFSLTIAATKNGRPDQFVAREIEDAAIIEFRPHLPSERKRLRFDATCEKYYDSRKRAYPEVADIYGHKIQAFPRNEAVRKEFTKTLDDLLAYANKS